MEVKHEYHAVFAKVRKADGSETIIRNNVRGKSAETRWIRALELNNTGWKVLTYWNVTDGRGLDENGLRA